MSNKLPSHNINLEIVVDVILYLGINPNVKIASIVEYVGKSESYVRSALTIGKLIGIINKDNVVENSFLKTLGKTPSKELKIRTIKKYIQQWEPFIVFIQYCLTGDKPEDAARKVYVLYNFSGKDPKFLYALFANWGKTMGTFEIKDSTFTLNEKVKKKYLEMTPISLDIIDDEVAIRLYIIRRLSEEVYSFLTEVEINELIEAFKISKNSSRSSIECAARAFEDFLRTIALKVGVDVTKAKGISQIVNRLYNNKDASGGLDNKIHSKQYSLGSALGDIRNMAGHSKEAKTMERWQIDDDSSRTYIELILSSIRSIYEYVLKNNYYF